MWIDGGWAVDALLDRKTRAHADLDIGLPTDQGYTYGGDDARRYPAALFAATGRIGGQAVRCPEPATLVSFHTGYAHDADDEADVLALCAAFGLDVPAQYENHHQDRDPGG